MTGAGGGIATAAGAGVAAGELSGVIGASLIRAAEGNEAASGEGFCTTRRFARCGDGATAADNADGDKGVTPLAINAAAALIFSADDFSTAGFSIAGFSAAGLSASGLSASAFSVIVFSERGLSLRIRSTAFSL